MQINKSFNSLSLLVICVVFLVACIGNAKTSYSKTINAGFVMNKMNVDQQVSYIAGVIEGLAFSRYLRDKPNQKSMKCVYGWYAENTGGPQKWKKMEAWLAKHPDKPVGVLLYVLIKRKCGA
jgi:hypothetical protein